MNRGSVILLGIDGFNWMVLDKFGGLGYMPNLGEVLREGVGGVASSIVPPVTGAAWLSIATGLTPGDTGVADFFKRVNGWRLELVSSKDYEGRSVWDYASLEGLHVGVLNYPLLYPPYPLRGFMVSGLGSPDDYPSSWPEDVVEKLAEKDALYRVYVNYHDERYNDLDLFFKDVEEHIRRFARAVDLLFNPGLDLFVVVVQATDWVFHRLWAHLDESHPLYSRLRREEVETTRRWFYEFLSMVDDVVGKVLDCVGGDGNVVIVSDHGFGPQYGVFNLCKWLVSRRYMVIRKGEVTKLKLYTKLLRLLRPLYGFSKRVFGELVVSKARSIATETLKDINLRVIDLSRSKAICLGHTIPFGALYLVEDDENARGIMEDLIRDLASQGLSVQAFLSKKLYMGKYTRLLPDILFLVENGRVVVLQELNRLNDPLYRSDPFSPRHTGSHRLEGFFAAWGKNVSKNNERVKVSIIDIAPTLIYLLDIPISKNIRGKPLTNIFNRSREPRYVDPSYYARKRIAFRARMKFYNRIARS